MHSGSSSLKSVMVFSGYRSWLALMGKVKTIECGASIGDTILGCYEDNPARCSWRWQCSKGHWGMTELLPCIYQHSYWMVRHRKSQFKWVIYTLNLVYRSDHLMLIIECIHLLLFQNWHINWDISKTIHRCISNDQWFHHITVSTWVRDVTNRTVEQALVWWPDTRLKL